MSKEQKPPFRIVDYKIPFGERVSLAVSQLFATIAVVITATLLLPVNFLRTLFTPTRKVVEVNVNGISRPLGGTQAPFSSPFGDEEPWMREHREHFGDEED